MENNEKTLYADATDIALQPSQRAVQADKLDKLGCRPNDLYNFVSIPDLKAPDFLIARYPVTNAQYARFLEPGNFSDKNLWCDFPRIDEHGRMMKAHWSDAGWLWERGAVEYFEQVKYRSPYPILYPKYWRGYGWDNPAYDHRRSLKPVGGINWYEANAYCRWLLAHWNELEEGQQGVPKPKLVRLPARQEWLVAAGGEQPAGRFPWDEVGQAETMKKDKLDTVAEVARRANVRESGINRATPVWMYPQGASKPYGLMDLGGNTWEWQANYDESRGTMWLLGGSWYYAWYNARVAVRYCGAPDIRRGSFGFRVLVLPG